METHGGTERHPEAGEAPASTQLANRLTCASRQRSGPCEEPPGPRPRSCRHLLRTSGSAVRTLLVLQQQSALFFSLITYMTAEC